MTKITLLSISKEVHTSTKTHLVIDLFPKLVSEEKKILMCINTNCTEVTQLKNNSTVTCGSRGEFQTLWNKRIHTQESSFKSLIQEQAARPLR